MHINMAWLKQNGYTVKVHHDGYGDPTGVTVVPTGAVDDACFDQVHETLTRRFHTVDHDTLMAITTKAVNQANNHAILELVSRTPDAMRRSAVNSEV